MVLVHRGEVEGNGLGHLEGNGQATSKRVEVSQVPTSYRRCAEVSTSNNPPV